MTQVENFIEEMLQWDLSQLAIARESDVMAIYGPMHSDLAGNVRDEIEGSAESGDRNDTLTILLNTGGGLVDSVERTVSVIRHHYKCVDFIIPDQAMSAGTVFALSADNIYMDYYSQLGPIDPQFFVDGKWLPGLGYLEKLKEFSEKSIEGKLSPLEFSLAGKLDLASLHRYEQAREHSVELLEKWLPAFKFKNWNKRQSTGEEVDQEKKQNRAKEIALKLNDTKRWHSHTRGISMKVLQDELDLKIEDMSMDSQFHDSVKRVHAFIVDFMKTSKIYFCLRTACYFKSESDHEQN